MEQRSISMQKEKPKIEHIIIACCTYKREKQLETTIQSLISMDFPEDIKTEILIVDNDEQKSAESVVEKYRQNAPAKILYTVENSTGLSNVRNKALNKAIELGATHIAFIDDDETATPEWLIRHINFYNNQKDIFVSSGPTFVKFDKKYPAHIENNDVFKKPTTKKFGQIRKTCASGNVFFPLNIVKENNLYFSEKFNFSGGEDSDFFKRVSENGYAIGWNPDAINYEIAGAERANIKWILARKYFNGFAVSQLKFNGKKFGIKKIFYITEKTLTVFINVFMSIFSILFGLTCFFNVCGLTAKNLGKLLGTLTNATLNYYTERKPVNV